jgi:integrase/recombinase XerD
MWLITGGYGGLPFYYFSLYYPPSTPYGEPPVTPRDAKKWRTPQQHSTRTTKKADGKWTMGKPAVKGNSRLKPLWVMVDGKVDHHPEARYKVSWYDSGKKRFEDVGQDPDVALATLNRREKSLEAKASGLTGLNDSEAKGRVLLSAAIAVYVDDAADGKKAKKTHSARKRTMDLFRESCNKTFVDQIDLRDMLNFKSHLRKQGFADRTVFNHFECANSFLRANGVISTTGKSIVPSHEWPDFNEKPVKKYQPEQLAKLFAEADEMETAVFKFFLLSGGREGEVGGSECHTSAYGCLRFSSYLFCRKNCKIGLLGRWKYLDVSRL